VNSIIKKIFPKKPSASTPASDQDLYQQIQKSKSNEIGITKGGKDLVSTQKKPDIEHPQLITGVAHSVGNQREHNEDALFTLTTSIISGDKSLLFGLFIIADGMGGHENGEIASGLALDQFASHVVQSLYLPLLSPSNKNVHVPIQEIMQEGIIFAHKSIKKEAIGSGTTLTSALIFGEQVTIAHVGDSRAYLCDPSNHFRLLTHDHSVVKRLEEIGQITPEQALTHPQRNVLYRALGQGEPLEPDIATYQLQPGSLLLLCSDGLWGVMSNDEIEAVVRSYTEPQYACQELVNRSNSAGGPDNISVIIVRMPD
jgi:protein phosphatase